MVASFEGDKIVIIYRNYRSTPTRKFNGVGF
jgi:hypothetical protein